MLREGTSRVTAASVQGPTVTSGTTGARTAPSAGISQKQMRAEARGKQMLPRPRSPVGERAWSQRRGRGVWDSATLDRPHQDTPTSTALQAETRTGNKVSAGLQTSPHRLPPGCREQTSNPASVGGQGQGPGARGPSCGPHPEKGPTSPAGFPLRMRNLDQIMWTKPKRNCGLHGESTAVSRSVSRATNEKSGEMP